MYYSGLRRAIQNVEEKRFYDVALLFLTAEGYRDVSIIDGTGDGGRDVSCSRQDLRIQLSVRKDWRTKINEEASTTRLAGKRHLIYITNRLIRESELAEFRRGNYKQKGEVELSVFDLNRVSTALSAPGVINVAYEKLGHIVQGKISATPKEIALSNILLFSQEAKDAREDAIESNIRAYIYKNSGCSREGLMQYMSSSLTGISIESNAATILSRLQSKGEVIIEDGSLSLSSRAFAQAKASEEDYLQSISQDIEHISRTYSLSAHDAKEIIELALEVAARDGSFNGDGVQEIALLDFISNKRLGTKKDSLYEDLSKLSWARVKQFGRALDHMFSTNTFDIYRALGRTTDVQLLLDSSVAMPLLFGLCFESVKSRYSISAAALHRMCSDHGIKIAIPRAYINEIVFHGKEALEFVQIYGALTEDNKQNLRSASNAYLSHYSHLRLAGELGPAYSLDDFLGHFGLKGNAPPRKVENVIESLLEDFGISIISVGKWEQSIRQEIANSKPKSAPIIIDHDASVCSFLKNSTDHGYIFATWDKVMIDMVEGKSRVFASSPAKVADFLSMAGGAEMETEQSFSLLTSLLYCDEKKAAALAQRIEELDSVERVYEYQAIAASARSSSGLETGKQGDE